VPPDNTLAIPATSAAPLSAAEALAAIAPNDRAAARPATTLDRSLTAAAPAAYDGAASATASGGETALAPTAANSGATAATAARTSGRSATAAARTGGCAATATLVSALGISRSGGEACRGENECGRRCQ
jgi:hypothetical protein